MQTSSAAYPSQLPGRGCGSQYCAVEPRCAPSGPSNTLFMPSVAATHRFDGWRENETSIQVVGAYDSRGYASNAEVKGSTLAEATGFLVIKLPLFRLISF